MEGLGSLWDCVRDIDWWSRTPPSSQERLQETLYKKQWIVYLPAGRHEEGTSGTARDGNEGLLRATSSLPRSLCHLPRCPLRSWGDLTVAFGYLKEVCKQEGYDCFTELQNGPGWKGPQGS